MEKEKLTLYLDPDIAKKFRILCAEHKISYGKYVEKWVKQELEGKK